MSHGGGLLVVSWPELKKASVLNQSGCWQFVEPVSNQSLTTTKAQILDLSQPRLCNKPKQCLQREVAFKHRKYENTLRRLWRSDSGRT